MHHKIAYIYSLILEIILCSGKSTIQDLISLAKKFTITIDVKDSCAALDVTFLKNAVIKVTSFHFITSLQSTKINASKISSQNFIVLTTVLVSIYIINSKPRSFLI